MTSKLTKRKKVYGTLEIFPDFPPRDDLQNALHLHRPSLQAALTEHLGHFDSTIVLSEIPVRWTPGQARGHRIPDLLVAFSIDREQEEFQNGYSIRDLGKPPDFVLEVASVRTVDNDVGPKRRDYANFGIPEYWRFDPTETVGTMSPCRETGWWGTPTSRWKSSKSSRTTSTATAMCLTSACAGITATCGGTTTQKGNTC